MEENEELLDERIEELNGLVTVFCRLHLNESYELACLLTVSTLGSHWNEPLAQGDLNLWAAGIVSRTIADLGPFQKPGQPFVSDKVIASHFGVKPLAMREKSSRVAQLESEADEEEDDSFFGADEFEDIYPPDYVVQDGEFIDEPRDLDDDYLDVGIDMFSFVDPHIVTAELLAFTKREPDFLFPYLDLHKSEEIMQAGTADTYLAEAYKRALRLIGAASGQWPRLIESTRPENRHITFTFLQQAERWWELGETEKALGMLRKILEVDPLDDMKARHQLAAILEGHSKAQWEELMDDEDLSDEERTAIFMDDAPSPADKWFAAIESKYPEEFEPWRQRWAERRQELGLGEDDADGEDF